VPEFNSGAMENVAAVTFNERLLSRSALTRDQRRNSAGIVLHEMAHMWFGNIVTMAWWNDLWLNESFATFMANLAMHESTEFKESWQDFFADMKDWAYWEDGLVTTHPIEAPVMNVKDAFANFDGITYGKGASVLKQLRYYIGDKAFREGIQFYMQTHAYKNTELKDFIAALQAKTDKNLSAWADVWLRQSGTDSIAANWACTGDRLKEIGLNVRPSAGARFRPQSLDVGLYKMEARGLKRIASVRVDLTKPVESLKGDWACPSFVYPNDNDYGFIASELDWRSLMFLKKQLHTVTDDLLRTIIWNDLWEMVRVGKMPLKEYIEIVDEQFPKENDLIVRSKIVSSIQSAIVYWPEGSTTSIEARKAFIERIEKTFLARFQNSKPGSDDQKFWFDNFVSFARSAEAMKQLRTWSTAKNAAPGLPMDLDRQWNIAYQLSRFQDGEAKAKIEALSKKDTSDRGVRGKLSAEVVQPVPEVKREWIDKMTQAKPALSLAESRSVLSAMFPSEQKSLAKPYDERFYAFVSENAKVENEMYLRTFVRALAPVSCEASRSDRLRAYLKKQQLSPSVSKSLKVSLQEDERCQMVRAKSNL
jgi:aminopeptidase N